MDDEDAHDRPNPIQGQLHSSEQNLQFIERGNQHAFNQNNQSDAIGTGNNNDPSIHGRTRLSSSIPASRDSTLDSALNLQRNNNSDAFLSTGPVPNGGHFTQGNQAPSLRLPRDVVQQNNNTVVLPPLHVANGHDSHSHPDASMLAPQTWHAAQIFETRERPINDIAAATASKGGAHVRIHDPPLTFVHMYPKDRREEEEVMQQREMDTAANASSNANMNVMTASNVAVIAGNDIYPNHAAWSSHNAADGGSGSNTALLHNGATASRSFVGSKRKAERGDPVDHRDIALTSGLASGSRAIPLHQQAETQSNHILADVPLNPSTEQQTNEIPCEALLQENDEIPNQIQEQQPNEKIDREQEIKETLSHEPPKKRSRKNEYTSVTGIPDDEDSLYEAICELITKYGQKVAATSGIAVTASSFDEPAANPSGRETKLVPKPDDTTTPPSSAIPSSIFEILPMLRRPFDAPRMTIHSIADSELDECPDADFLVKWADISSGLSTMFDTISMQGLEQGFLSDRAGECNLADEDDEMDEGSSEALGISLDSSENNYSNNNTNMEASPKIDGSEFRIASSIPSAAAAASVAANLGPVQSAGNNPLGGINHPGNTTSPNINGWNANPDGADSQALGSIKANTTRTASAASSPLFGKGVDMNMFRSRSAFSVQAPVLPTVRWSELYSMTFRIFCFGEEKVRLHLFMCIRELLSDLVHAISEMISAHEEKDCLLLYCFWWQRLMRFATQLKRIFGYMHRYWIMYWKETDSRNEAIRRKKERVRPLDIAVMGLWRAKLRVQIPLIIKFVLDAIELDRDGYPVEARMIRELIVSIETLGQVDLYARYVFFEENYDANLLKSFTNDPARVGDRDLEEDVIGLPPASATANNVSIAITGGTVNATFGGPAIAATAVTNQQHIPAIVAAPTVSPLPLVPPHAITPVQPVPVMPMAHGVPATTTNINTAPGTAIQGGQGGQEVAGFPAGAANMNASPSNFGTVDMQATILDQEVMDHPMSPAEGEDIGNQQVLGANGMLGPVTTTTAHSNPPGTHLPHLQFVSTSGNPPLFGSHLPQISFGGGSGGHGAGSGAHRPHLPFSSLPGEHPSATAGASASGTGPSSNRTPSTLAEPSAATPTIPPVNIPLVSLSNTGPATAFAGASGAPPATPNQFSLFPLNLPVPPLATAAIELSNNNGGPAAAAGSAAASTTAATQAGLSSGPGAQPSNAGGPVASVLGAQIWLGNNIVREPSPLALTDQFAAVVFAAPGTEVAVAAAINARAAASNTPGAGRDGDNDQANPEQKLMSVVNLSGHPVPLELQYYVREFESRYISRTLKYFRTESAEFLADRECTLLSFMNHVMERCAEETLRAQRYLHPNSEIRVLHVVDDVLIRRNIDYLLSGAKDMVRNLDQQALHKLYLLLTKVDTGLNRLQEEFRSHVSDEGAMIFMNRESEFLAEGIPKRDALRAISLIDDLIAVYKKHLITVNTCFQRSQLFTKALDEAFCFILNNRTGSFKIAEILAYYCDKLLRSDYVHSVEPSLPQTFDDLVRILMYLDNKEIFHDAYRRLLSRRLLNEESSRETEQLLLNKIKASTGPVFTSMLLGMLHDLALSEELNLKLKAHCMKNPEVDGDHLNDMAGLFTDQHHGELSLPAFHIYVLNSLYWPSFKTDNLVLPPKLSKCIGHFSTFYGQITNARKLAFINSQSTVVISADPKLPLTQLQDYLSDAHLMDSVPHQHQRHPQQLAPGLTNEEPHYTTDPHHKTTVTHHFSRSRSREAMASHQPHDRFEIRVSVYQACALLLFNTRDSISLPECSALLGLSMEDVKTHLEPLATGEYSLLKVGERESFQLPLAVEIGTMSSKSPSTDPHGSTDTKKDSEIPGSQTSSPVFPPNPASPVENDSGRRFLAEAMQSWKTSSLKWMNSTAAALVAPLASTPALSNFAPILGPSAGSSSAPLIAPTPANTASPVVDPTQEGTGNDPRKDAAKPNPATPILPIVDPGTTEVAAILASASASVSASASASVTVTNKPNVSTLPVGSVSAADPSSNANATNMNVLNSNCKTIVYKLNSDFLPRADQRMLIVPPTTPISTKLELKHVRRATQVDHTIQIDSIIIKLMKHNREMEHNDLVEQVTTKCTHLFQPDVRVVKQRIEYLIDSEYMERSPDNANVYNYVA